VLLLLRPKRGQAPAARVAALLRSGLFHHIRDRPELVAKVVVVAGDISKPGLGLGHEDRDAVTSQAHFVLHSAASIELEADIHDTLTVGFLEGGRVGWRRGVAAQPRQAGRRQRHACSDAHRRACAARPTHCAPPPP
jgi:hypothetical protein